MIIADSIRVQHSHWGEGILVNSVAAKHFTSFTTPRRIDCVVSPEAKHRVRWVYVLAQIYHLSFL